MLTQKDVLEYIDNEKKSLKRRKWLKNEWTEKNRKSLEDDLNKQRKKVEEKKPDFFNRFNDVFDALEEIENEIYGENEVFGKRL